MFNKVKQGKQLMDMRAKAKKLERELSEITETVEEGDVKVKVTANQKIEYVEIDGEMNDEVADAVNKAFKKVQKKAAQKMMEMGGGLGGLLGGM